MWWIRAHPKKKDGGKNSTRDYYFATAPPFVLRIFRMVVSLGFVVLSFSLYCIYTTTILIVTTLGLLIIFQKDEGCRHIVS